MPRRRNRPGPLSEARDDREHGLQPFDFTHRAYVVELGVAHEGVDGELVFDISGLANYSPPAGATDGLLIAPQVRSYNGQSYEVMAAVPAATRLDPVAAQWLWVQRTKHETDPACNPDGIVTRSAWCTCCGRHFEAGAKLRSLRAIGQWCARCRNRRTRKNPQLLPCTAPDCEHWFHPLRAGQQYCAPACEQADRRRLAARPTGSART